MGDLRVVLILQTRSQAMKPSSQVKLNRRVDVWGESANDFVFDRHIKCGLSLSAIPSHFLRLARQVGGSSRGIFYFWLWDSELHWPQTRRNSGSPPCAIFTDSDTPSL